MISGSISTLFPNTNNLPLGDYVVEGELIIDKTFTIAGDQTLRFKEGASILIKAGKLLSIIGESNVSFIPCDSNIYWNGIRFEDATSRFTSTHCKIVHATIGLNAENGGIIILSTKTIIENCQMYLVSISKTAKLSTLRAELNGYGNYNCINVLEDYGLITVNLLKSVISNTSWGSGVVISSNSNTQNFANIYNFDNCTFNIQEASAIRFNSSFGIKTITNSKFYYVTNVFTSYMVFNAKGSGVYMENDSMFGHAKLVHTGPSQYLQLADKIFVYLENEEYKRSIIKNCYFEKMGAGIWSNNCSKGVEIYTNSFSDVRFPIILINQSNFKKAIRSYIQSNTIYNSYVFGQTVGDGILGIQVNTPYSINEVVLNIINILGQRSTGILLSNVSQSLISENQVRLVNFNDSKYAIRFEGSFGNTSRYNITNNFTNGQYFIGACEGTKFYCNKFEDHVDGLYIYYGTYIGPQKHKWNRWTGTYSDAGAYNGNESEPTILDFSKFTVADPLGSIYHPTHYPTDFFNVNPTNSGMDNCNTMSPNPTPPIDEQETLERIIGAETNNSAIKATVWEDKKQAYIQLLSDTSLLSQSSILTTFFQNESNTPLGQFARIHHVLTDIQNYLPYPDIDNLLSQIHQKAQQRSNLLENGYASDAPEVVQLDTEITALNLQFQLQADANATAKQTLLTQLKQTNAAILTTQVYEENLKQMNDINLHYLLQHALSTAQLATVTTMANLCGVSNGSAVYMARGFYLQHINKNIQFDDADICVAIGAAQRNGHDSSGIIIAPNPTKGIVRIELPDSKQQIWVEVTDANGKSYIKQQGESTLNVDLTTFPSGIYFVKVLSEKGYVVKKIVKMN